MDFLSMFSVAWILFFVIELATSRLVDRDCKKTIRTLLNNGKRINRKHIRDFEKCLKKREDKKCDDKISELEEDYNDYWEGQKSSPFSPDYTPETEKCPPSYEIVVKDPKKLAKHIQCDKNNSESDPECIQRLQGLLEKFVNIDPKLEQEEHETLYRYKLRMGHLMTGAKQAYKHYSNLYDRCESGVSRGFG